jgi:hypothetical protein
MEIVNQSEEEEYYQNALTGYKSDFEEDDQKDDDVNKNEENQADENNNRRSKEEETKIESSKEEEKFENNNEISFKCSMPNCPLDVHDSCPGCEDCSPEFNAFCVVHISNHSVVQTLQIVPLLKMTIRNSLQKSLN